MPKRVVPLALVLFIILSSVPLPVAADPPHADAGLDQTVVKGTTVQLDATGSTDPDGSITLFDWRITDPDGNQERPDCATCGQTTFRADTVGTYNVTVEVTGTNGDTATDTLFVHVEPGDPPSAVVTGPSNLQTGQTGTYVTEANAGDATLDSIVWRVDGATVQVDSVTGSSATSSLDRQYATSGSHQITARVVDTDDQSDTDSLATSVFEPQPAPDPSDATGPVQEPTTPTTGDRGSAVIRGPQLVTGSKPLQADYTIEGSHIETIHWWKDGARVGSGPTFSEQFTPGEHRLHASIIYTDGTTDTARFSSGTTTVTADPEPRLIIRSLSGKAGLSLESLARDGYGNLRHIKLKLDNETVLERELDPFELQKDHSGHRLDLSADTLDVDPGWYDVTFTATDARGQTTTRNRYLEVYGPPEVISAGFDQRDDIDIYHPRIDANRYTVEHVMEIDLNGANPGTVRANHDARYIKTVNNSECTFNREQTGDRLEITTCWAGTQIREYSTTTNVVWMNQVLPSRLEANFSVTPSDPEVRIRVISGGAVKNAKDWGVVVDASDSFDPDGTRIEYDWTGDAEGLNAKSSIGKFDSLDDGGLIVKDRNGGKVRVNEAIVAHFNPKVTSTREISGGPYVRGDYVKFVVQTRAYELNKNSYRSLIELKLVPTSGEVLSHSTYHGPHAGDVRDNRFPIGAKESFSPNHELQYWAISVPAKAFLEGSPSFQTYNVNNKKETLDEFTFPEPYVLIPGERYAKNTTLSQRYLVEVPTYSVISTQYELIREQRLDQGFDVVTSEETGTQWNFERKVLKSPAKIENLTRNFSSRSKRSVFLDLNPNWLSAGSSLVTTTEEETSYEWRRSKEGSGQYTGETREVKVQSATYRVDKKYKYEKKTKSTKTKEVEKEYRYQKTETYTKTVEKCNDWVGCYETEVTRERDVWKTGTKKIKKKVTVTKTETKTYWDTGKRHHSHTYTATSKNVKTQEEKHRTEYKYAVTETTQVQERQYYAKRTRVVEPAEFAWQPHKSTRSQLVADQLKLQPDIRLKDTVSVTEWTLRKRTGTDRTVQKYYSNESQVILSYINVTGTIVRPHKDPDTKETVLRNETDHSYSYKTEGLDDANVIIDKYISNYVEEIAE